MGHDPLICSINICEGARGLGLCHSTTCANPSHCFLWTGSRDSRCVHGASTSAYDVPPSTCGLREGATTTVALIDREGDDRDRLLMRAYIGSLLQLFFYCDVYLVLTTHNFLFASFLGDMIDVSSPFPYNKPVTENGLKRREASDSNNQVTVAKLCVDRSVLLTRFRWCHAFKKLCRLR
jgi:hypothetical protein